MSILIKEAVAVGPIIFAPLSITLLIITDAGNPDARYRRTNRFLLAEPFG